MYRKPVQSLVKFKTASRPLYSERHRYYLYTKKSQKYCYLETEEIYSRLNRNGEKRETIANE